jgi:hypothetical protein
MLPREIQRIVLLIGMACYRVLADSGLEQRHGGGQDSNGLQ